MLHGTVTASFSGIEKLKELIEFHCDVTSQKPYPDFSKLVSLEKCFLAWDKKYDVKDYQHGLFTLPKLKDLTLRYWTKADCTEIGSLKQLQTLDLRQGVLSRLDGLDNCPDLRTLELSYLPKLVDISRLDHVHGLEKILIQNCPNIADYAPLTHLTNLRHIHLEKVNAQFRDLKWLAKMERIEKIVLSCEILELDWEILFNHPTLKDVAISSHDGYNITDSEILDIAERASRTVTNFRRMGTRKRPSFVFDLE
jgi:hypothetical protein